MMNEIDGAKLLLNYDVLPDQADDYFRFFIGRYIPVMQTLGMEVSEAWQTAYGNAPDRMIGFISPNRQQVMDLVQDSGWSNLNQELTKYVANFTFKVIPYQQGFQF